MVTKYPALRGNPKFDACFQWGNWRQIDELKYMPTTEATTPSSRRLDDHLPGLRRRR